MPVFVKEIVLENEDIVSEFCLRDHDNRVKLTFNSKYNSSHTRPNFTTKILYFKRL